MSRCPHTGVSVPECSCTACVQALIARHMPSASASAPTEAEVSQLHLTRIRRWRPARRLRALRQRRVA